MGGRDLPWAFVSSAMDSGPYRKLLYASAAVIFGVMGQAVARGWLARDLTGNNTGLGGVMLAFGIAMLIATPWGGVAADRFSKRRVLLVSVSLLVVTSLLIGLAVVADVIEYWMLLVASAIQATAFALFLPARIAFIADVVEPEAIGPAVTLNQTTQEAMRVIAPALAGALIGLSWFGVGGVFLLVGGHERVGLRHAASAATRVATIGLDAVTDRRDGRCASDTSAPALASDSSHSPRSVSWSSASRTSRSSRRWPTSASMSAPAATG